MSREKYRMRTFQKRVMRTISDPKWDKVRGDWRKLYIQEPHDLYSKKI
jgi:hypothetical protein